MKLLLLHVLFAFGFYLYLRKTHFCSDRTQYSTSLLGKINRRIAIFLQWKPYMVQQFLDSMWIDNNKIGYDYAGLDEVLSYRHKTIYNLRYELFEMLWRGEYLGDFWEVAAEGFSTEIISVVLQSFERSHLQYLLSDQNRDGDIALHKLAYYRRADAINTVQACVNDEWRYHLLQTASGYPGTPIH